MKLIKHFTLAAVACSLLSGCVSPMSTSDLQKYKGSSPATFYADQWYINQLGAGLFVFEAALLKQDQVAKTVNDLKALCRTSGGAPIFTPLTVEVVDDTVNRLNESHSSDKYRPSLGGNKIIYSANFARQYTTGKVYSFNRDHYVDQSMKNYVKEDNFGTISCKTNESTLWITDVVFGDIYTDSSGVVSLPVFIQTHQTTSAG